MEFDEYQEKALETDIMEGLPGNGTLKGDRSER